MSEADNSPLIFLVATLLIFVVLLSSSSGDGDAAIAGKNDDEAYTGAREKKSPTMTHDRSPPATWRTEIRELESRLSAMEKGLQEMEAESYPNIDQQVAMRRDIDRLIVHELPLMRESLLAMNARIDSFDANQISLTWFDADSAQLNHTNDPLLEFANSDIVCVHNARLPLARLDPEHRIVNAIDVFKPVFGYRTHYMLLCVNRIEHNEALVSGIAISSSLDATFSRDEVSDGGQTKHVRLYTRGEHRLLALRCVVNGTNECVIATSYDLDNAYADADNRLIDEFVEQMQSEFVEQRVRGETESSDLSVYLIGHIGCNVETFRRDTVPRLTNIARLKSEFEYCVRRPIITDFRADIEHKLFRHNVHALSNERISRFSVDQIAKNRLAVNASFALGRPRGSDNDDTNLPSLHGKKIM